MAYRGTSIKSIQQVDVTGSGTTFTKTITAVDPNNTILIMGGTNRGVSGFGYEYPFTFGYAFLTNSTTITGTRGLADGTMHMIVTVLEFRPGTFKSNVQRGTISIGAATSNTASISAVDVTRAVVSSTGWTTAGAAGDRADEIPRLSLASTIVTATKQLNTTNNTYTIGFEVYEFK